MKKTLFAAALAVALGGGLAGPARADRADDDLAAVKKAVGGTQVAQARPPAEEPQARPERPARPVKSLEGKWLRVRIVERAGKHGKVSINVPLGLARAFGEDWRIHDCDDCGHRGPTLGEVLRALESGQSLVDIDDDEASIKVWVD